MVIIDDLLEHHVAVQSALREALGGCFVDEEHPIGGHSPGVSDGIVRRNAVRDVAGNFGRKVGNRIKQLANVKTADRCAAHCLDHLPECLSYSYEAVDRQCWLFSVFTGQWMGRVGL